MPTPNHSGIRPVKNRVVLLPEEVQEVSKGGIVLATQTAEREALSQIYGTVVAVGPDCQGHQWWRRYVGFIPALRPEYRVGDRVIFGKYSGLIEPGADGQKKYRIVNDRDIVAVKE